MRIFISASLRLQLLKREPSRAAGRICAALGALALSGGVLSDFPQLRRTGPAPNVILETTYKNPGFNTANGNWANNLVGGHTFMGILHDTKFEWTQVISTAGEYDDDFIGLCGWVVTPDISHGDNPFDHPFCSVDHKNYDWECLIAPDKPYQSLSAPTTTSEYVAGAALSARRGHPISSPYSVLGVETDNELMPGVFRALDGDRTCTWGRWIVDTGHDDFHTEIHPPALMVNARPMPANSPDVTFSTVLGRPYLVGQTYTSDGYAMKDHMLNEIRKVKELIGSTRIEAHPNIMPKPFRGVHIMTYIVRPPTGRNLATDKLMLTYQFTIRTGIAVQLTNTGDSVTVYVLMNDAQYKAPSLPTRHDVNITKSIMDDLGYETQWWGLFIGSILTPGSPLTPLIELRGILTDNYDSPTPPTFGPATSIDVTKLSGNSAVTVDNKQPYPIAGLMTLKWLRGAEILKRN